MKLQSTGAIAFIVFVSILGSLYYLKQSRWKEYYERKLKEKPREFVIDSLKLINLKTQPKIAYDLGCGIGHETLLLLENGFQVIAIDKESLAINILLARPDIIQYKNNLKTIVSGFEELDFNNAPNTDLIVAMFALPFASPSFFNQLWSSLTKKLKSKGYFIGTFFDPGFNVFQEKDRKKMIFHTKSEILELLKDFDIITFKETKEAAKEPAKIDHYYQILAQKK